MKGTYLSNHIHGNLKLPWTTPVRRQEIEWYHVLKFFANEGVVFRSVGPMVQCWLQGTVYKKGDKSVWRKGRRGLISILRQDAQDADVLRIEARAPWLH